MGRASPTSTASAIAARGRIARLWEIRGRREAGAARRPAILCRSSRSGTATSSATASYPVYALLGLGLNVIVGFAGLLDLGYVAFFGFGAYIYGYVSGPLAGGHAYTHHWPPLLSIPLATVASARCSAVFLGYSSRRLLGDYLAIVTLFFGQAFVVFTTPADPYGITGGSNGLANIDPIQFFGGPL